MHRNGCDFLDWGDCRGMDTFAIISKGDMFMTAFLLSFRPSPSKKGAISNRKKIPPKEPILKEIPTKENIHSC